jgi:hypothetical protein
MQLRCTYCQTMFAISREETLAALESMDENNLKYYDAHCPKCRRANRVERFRLEFSYPGWREAIKVMAKQAAAAGTAPAAQAQPVTALPPKVSPAAEIASPKGKAPRQAHAHKAAAKAIAAPAAKSKPAAKPAPKPAAMATPKAGKKPAAKPSAKAAPAPKKKAVVSSAKAKPAAKTAPKGKKPAAASAKVKKPSPKGKKPAGARKK